MYTMFLVPLVENDHLPSTWHTQLEYLVIFMYIHTRTYVQCSAIFYTTCNWLMSRRDRNKIIILLSGKTSQTSVLDIVNSLAKPFSYHGRNPGSFDHIRPGT